VNSTSINLPSPLATEPKYSWNLTGSLLKKLSLRSLIAFDGNLGILSYQIPAHINCSTILELHINYDILWVIILGDVL
jgi:hypothetical protein